MNVERPLLLQSRTSRFSKKADATTTLNRLFHYLITIRQKQKQIKAIQPLQNKEQFPAAATTFTGTT